MDAMNLLERIKGKISYEVNVKVTKDGIHVNVFHDRRLR